MGISVRCLALINEKVVKITMIERVIWTGSTSVEKRSPFLCGSNKPLKITFHTSSFTRASSQEHEAIRLLRELCNLTNIEALDTQDGNLPHINFGTYQNSDNDIPISIISEEGITYSYITYIQQLKRIALGIVRKNKLSHSETQAVFNDLIIA